MGDGFAERRTATNLNGDTGQAEFRKDHGRYVWSGTDPVRIKCHAPRDTAKEHLSIRALEAGSPASQIVSRKTVRGGVIGEPFGFGIESGQSPVGAHPQAAVFILQDAAY